MVTRSVVHEKFPFTYWLPGMVATLALLLLNMVPRNALESSLGSDEEMEVWLLTWYILSTTASKVPPCDALSGTVSNPLRSAMPERRSRMFVGVKDMLRL